MKNPVEESLKQLDLKGLLFLNGLIIERALQIVLEKEMALKNFAPAVKPLSSLLMPSKQILT